MNAYLFLEVSKWQEEVTARFCKTCIVFVGTQNRSQDLRFFDPESTPTSLQEAYTFMGQPLAEARCLEYENFSEANVAWLEHSQKGCLDCRGFGSRQGTNNFTVLVAYACDRVDDPRSK